MAQQDSRKLEQTKTPGISGAATLHRPLEAPGPGPQAPLPDLPEAREFKRTLGGAAKQPTTRETLAGYYDRLDRHLPGPDRPRA